jgi:hypothetical protein
MCPVFIYYGSPSPNYITNGQLITTAGTQSRIVPPGQLAMMVEGWGGGGGSDGSGGSGTFSGDGSGSGGYFKKLIFTTPMDSISFTIGAGGVGNALAGNTGGQTTISAYSLIANGGGPGQAFGGSLAGPGLGGTASGGDTNTTGENGEAKAGDASYGGRGGNAPNGGLGGARQTTNANGNNGVAPGGGGGGMRHTSGTRLGGSGGNGGVKYSG